MSRRFVVLAVLVLAALGVWWRVRTQPNAQVASGAITLTAPQDDPARCDALAPTQKLPPALPSSPGDLDAVVTALDQALDAPQKAWLRCFTDDEALIARSHQGLGRWLRHVLRLQTKSPLTTQLADLGLASADDASSAIIVAYAHRLRADEISPGDVAARVKALNAAAGAGR